MIRFIVLPVIFIGCFVNMGVVVFFQSFIVKST